MDTAHIKKVFSDYLSTEETDYAILLNGSWGKGKTFYYKNTLATIAQDKGLKPIYVTLNGHTKLERIEQEVFYKTFSKQDSEAQQSLMKVIWNGTNQLFKARWKTDLKDLISGVGIESLNFSKYLLVFDDLERSKMPIQEVLGYINKFVEHKRAKTLILADQDKIEDQERYKKIKEKLIGREISFDPNIDQALSSLMNKYKENEALFSFLQKHNSQILNQCKKLNQDNLRSISFLLEILAKIFPLLTSVEDHLQKQVITVTAIYCFNYKLGDPFNIYSKGNPPIVIENSSMFSFRDSNKEETDQSRFYDAYIKDNQYEYDYFESIYEYTFSGYFDEQKLNDELNARKPVDLPKHIKAMQELVRVDWRTHDDDKFALITSTVLECAKEGKYDLYDYLQVANYLIFFAEEKLVPWDEQAVQNDLFTGMEIAKLHSKINQKAMDTIDHFGPSTPARQVFVDEIRKFHKEKLDKSAIDNGTNFLEILKSENYEAIDSKFKADAFVTIFNFINPNELALALSTLSNASLNAFKNLMEYRYSSTNIGDFLYEDRANLLIATEQFAQYANDSTPPLRRYHILATCKVLEEIAAKLQATRKKHI